MSEQKYFNENIKHLERLIIDLKRLRDGKFPTKGELDQSPELTNWVRTSRPVACLEGNFGGHPDISNGAYGITSELYFLDPNLTFVRTFSRYYRLGAPAKFKR